MDTKMDPAEAEEKVDEGLELAYLLFCLRHPEQPAFDIPAIKEQVLEILTTRAASVFYSKFCEEFDWMVDESKLQEMTSKNEEEAKQLDERIADAEANLGDSEVREALLAKAEYLVRIGDKEKAIAAFKLTEEKTVAIGQKMDLKFTLLRLGYFHSDLTMVKKDLDETKKMFEEGGDWERKNRLKVYEGLYFMATREFKKAALLFLDSIATFTTYELFPYNTFIFYAVITSITSLDRVTLRSKVVDAPEILTVIDQVPSLSDFLNCLYKCDYLGFFKAFVNIADKVSMDMYLYPHYRYFMRQVRIVAYSQFLESYKSVTAESMALAFGVTPEFLDTELSSFISGGYLNCKIDKVNGIIQTNRPDAKNAHYQETIKQGDLLLNRIQKLSKVIDL